ncbi:hypothetical protein ACSMXM_05395 [Pacificimonas sp. ICDLI1SI03]
MNPFFCLPLNASIAASTTPSSGSLAADVLNDKPNLAYEVFASTAYITIDLGASISKDCFAALGSNLAATDTWRVRVGSSVSGTTSAPSYDSGTIPAWSGEKTQDYARLVHTAPSPVTGRYVRFDFTKALSPIRAARVLTGLKTEAPHGFDSRVSRLLQDQSIIAEGPAWEEVDEKIALPGWRVSFSWLTDAFWNETWWPFLQRAKASRPVLFVPFPDEPAKLQDSAVFGRIRSYENSHPIHDGWQNEIQILSNGL